MTEIKRLEERIGKVLEEQKIAQRNLEIAQQNVHRCGGALAVLHGMLNDARAEAAEEAKKTVAENLANDRNGTPAEGVPVED